MIDEQINGCSGHACAIVTCLRTCDNIELTNVGSLMWGFAHAHPITCKHCIDHHVVNNVCLTCDLILPSSPLQEIQLWLQVCAVCSNQQKQLQLVLQCVMLANHIALNDVTAFVDS